VSAHRVVSPTKDLIATSSLVRRLVHPGRDSAKKRICEWLSQIGDQQLLHFGLTPADIAILRREHVSMYKAKTITGTECAAPAGALKAPSIAATRVGHAAPPTRSAPATRPPSPPRLARAPRRAHPRRELPFPSPS
jgi:hypothetical protein